MIQNDKPQQLSSKAFAPHQWPIGMSKAVKKFHEHERCRGFHEHEVRVFKERGNWKGGEFVDKKPAAG